MIVETHDGRDIDLHDLDDLDDHRDPEPPDPEEEQPPVDLNAVTVRLNHVTALSLTEQLPPEAQRALRELLCDDFPGMVAELEELRERVAYWRSLPIQEEYAVTEGAYPGQAPTTWVKTSDHAMRLARRPGRTAWVRSNSVHTWQPFSSEPPF
ncbi:hypothetical protein ACQP10_38230 (plasmid) [Streptosporangium sandarakinum]|uniref:hypothetical protein n=1 Tax=Streptosporangium sandarakinum TaxID=1260955 RepID=UPI003D8AA27D